MKRLLVAISALGFFIFGPQALAAGNRTAALSLSLLYASDSLDLGDVTNSLTRTGIHFTAAFFIADGLAVGLTHHQIDDATASKFSNNGFTVTSTDTESKTGQGLFIGYFSNGGFNMGLSYLFNPQRADADETFSGGTAYVINIGQLFEVNKTWSIGFDIIYSSFAFTKYETNGVEVDLDDNRKETQLLPMGKFTLSL